MKKPEGKGKGREGGGGRNEQPGKQGQHGLELELLERRRRLGLVAAGAAGLGDNVGKGGVGRRGKRERRVNRRVPFARRRRSSS